MNSRVSLNGTWDSCVAADTKQGWVRVHQLNEDGSLKITPDCQIATKQLHGKVRLEGGTNRWPKGRTNLGRRPRRRERR
jgi:hypothetical protein